METIFDLPAHPLMVHFPIVAIPVFALLAIVMAVRPSFRTRYGTAMILFGIVTAVSTLVAAKSGEALADTYANTDYLDEHESLGELLRLFVIGLALAVIGMVVAHKRSASTGKDPLSLATSILAIALSLLSIVWVVRTGHEGAKAVWEGTVAVEDEGDESESAAADATSTTTTTEATTSTTTTTTPSETDAPTTVEETTTTDAAAVDSDGQVLFEANCARCHGTDGAGGRGPSLQGVAADLPDQQVAVDQVTNGGNGMPAFGARLSEAEIAAAVAYIYETF